MEHLTKQQIILLTLLVSFVTSIATGIVTVSLYSQAPAGVTQTINHVIEKTVEKVVPSQSASVVSLPVSQEDQLVDAVNQVKKSIIKIRSTSSVIPVDNIGLVVSKDGIIIVDKSVVQVSTGIIAIFPNGKEFPIQPIQVQSDGDIAFIIALIPDADKSKIDIHPITFASSIKLGQSVATLSLKDSDVLSEGIIEKVEGDNSTTTQQVKKVLVSILNSRVAIGSPLFNRYGEVIGLKTSSLVIEDSNPFYPLSLIKSVIPVIKK